MSPAEVVGSTGVALLLVAFALSSFGSLSARGGWYHALNLVGAGLSCAASAMIPFWPFVVLEGAWALVAVAGLLRWGFSGPRPPVGPRP